MEARRHASRKPAKKGRWRSPVWLSAAPQLEGAGGRGHPPDVAQLAAHGVLAGHDFPQDLHPQAGQPASRVRGGQAGRRQAGG